MLLKLKDKDLRYIITYDYDKNITGWVGKSNFKYKRDLWFSNNKNPIFLKITETCEEKIIQFSNHEIINLVKFLYKDEFYWADKDYFEEV